MALSGGRLKSPATMAFGDSVDTHEAIRREPISLIRMLRASGVTSPPQRTLSIPVRGVSRWRFTTQSHLDACLNAVQQLDSVALEAVLMRARVALSQPAFIEHLIDPLMKSIGDLFHDGSLRIMHEHMASAVVRSFLWSLQSSAEQAAYAPILIVATPVGQWHEIGALMVASTAAAEGWAITYLGANLPAQEIAAAVQQQSAKVVALSLVYPADDPRLHQELVALRRYVGQDVTLLIGGSGSTGYIDVLEDISAVRLDDIAQLRTHLETFRQPPRS
jgi:methylmalonyl-CoA mutase cobalamin-binding subunit